LVFIFNPNSLAINDNNKFYNNEYQELNGYYGEILIPKQFLPKYYCAKCVEWFVRPKPQP